MITHLFNAMTAFQHREPGVVGLLASGVRRADQPLYYGLIVDGWHTHDAALRIAFSTLSSGLFTNSYQRVCNCMCVCVCLCV